MDEVPVGKQNVNYAESKKAEAQPARRSQIANKVAIYDDWFEHAIATVLYVFENVPHDSHDNIRKDPNSQVEYVPVDLL